jgi:CubicO group peptidase (beta-lactamase class C family)
MPFQKTRALMSEAVMENVFPGAVLLVGLGEEVLLQQAFGYAALVPEKQILHENIIFDLASLTKPLATTLGIMDLVQRGRLSLDHALDLKEKGFGEGEKSEITLRHLLAHSAGCQAYHPYYLDLSRQEGDKKRILWEWVKKAPLLYPPGSEVLYSDLGFILLEWIFEETSGESLYAWTRKKLNASLGLTQMGFRPITPDGVSHPEIYAATENCPWRKKILRGEVHDENAYAVGGISGQAGLFGTAVEIFRLLRVLKKAYDHPEPANPFDGRLVRVFWERQKQPEGTTRALGFDTPSETGSSAGSFFSPESVGHLGFTGTSFWLDVKRDLLVVLLTNRVHPTRANEKIKSFRPKLHDLVFQETF